MILHRALIFIKFVIWNVESFEMKSVVPLSTVLSCIYALSTLYVVYSADNEANSLTKKVGLRGKDVEPMKESVPP